MNKSQKDKALAVLDEIAVLLSSPDLAPLYADKSRRQTEGVLLSINYATDNVREALEDLNNMTISE